MHVGVVLTQIEHSLLRDVEQCSVDLEHPGTRRDNHADLASPVEVSINVVRLVHCKAKLQAQSALKTSFLFFCETICIVTAFSEKQNSISQH